MPAGERYKIISGNANPDLAAEIAKYLGCDLVRAKVGRFNDGEVRVKVEESVRGFHVFVMQSTCPPVNENLMELLVLIDALKRASAHRITAVLPYFGYSRQDRKSQPREPVTAKLVANLVTVAGASRVVSIDLHAPQIQGFFDIPFDNLIAEPIFIDYFQRKELQNPVVVAPDVGAVKTGRHFAQKLGVPLAIIDKRRPVPNQAEVMNVVGEVQGHDVILLDDIIDTGGTIVNGAQALKERGCGQVFACCTHPVFSGSAREKLASEYLDELVVTDTIPLAWDNPRLKILSMAALLGEAIDRICKDLSVSALFY